MYTPCLEHCLSPIDIFTGSRFSPEQVDAQKCKVLPEAVERSGSSEPCFLFFKVSRGIVFPFFRRQGKYDVSEHRIRIHALTVCLCVLPASRRTCKAIFNALYPSTCSW